MNNIIADSSTEHPKSGIKVKARTIVYNVCPRCQRVNGNAYCYESNIACEQLISVKHNKLIDCFKTLWEPPYTKCLPVELSTQSLSSPSLWKIICSIKYRLNQFLTKEIIVL